MPRVLLVIGGLAIFVLVLVAGLYGYRSLFDRRTPEGYRLLTAMPGASGFEPTTLPKGPVLANRSAHGLAVHFGYEVGGVPYSYAMELNFPPGSETGQATLKARHASHDASFGTDAKRRWDEPRKAYAVALQGRFDVEPPVPSLCIKAVVGPQTEDYDLTDASLCVAQRDAAGNCHPNTLACGLIRP